MIPKIPKKEGVCWDCKVERTQSVARHNAECKMYKMDGTLYNMVERNQNKYI